MILAVRRFASASLTYERFRCRIPHDCVQRFHAPAEKLIPIRCVSLSIRVSSLALSGPVGKVGSSCVVAGFIRELLLFNVKAPPFAAAAATGRQTDTPTHSPACLSCLSIAEAPTSALKTQHAGDPPHTSSLSSPLLSSLPEHHTDTGRDLFNN